MKATDPAHMIINTSSHSTKETANRLVTLIQERGLTVFARIDHAANAERAGLSMLPSEVILFGNPNVGTQLMHSAPTIAIDLPQKFLVWDAGHTVKIAHPDMAYLKRLHAMAGVDDLINKISRLLDSLAAEAGESSS